MENKNNHFYSELRVNRMPLSQLFMEPGLFREVPKDWRIVITDIKGSTKAVDSGLHQDINLIATGCVAAVLNIVFRAGIDIPFFFGGDGATFIIPSSAHAEVMKTLVAFRAHVHAAFQLELRTGTVPVSEMYAEGHKLLIAKFQSSKEFVIPVVLGSGLEHAEKRIKGIEYVHPQPGARSDTINLKGMSCRWDLIPPPDSREEIVSLLVQSYPADNQGEVFSTVIRMLDDIYGVFQTRQPISLSKLKFRTSFSKVSDEVRATSGRVTWPLLLRNLYNTFRTWVFLKTKNGGIYLEKLVKMSDTIIIDGKINTVICGNRIQRNAMTTVLDGLESEGRILYGIHVSNGSVMSCYVRNHENGHIHFVDGAGGGYTMAARMLKNKLALKQMI